MNDLSGLCLSLVSCLEVAFAESVDAGLSFFNGITIRIRHSGRFTLRAFKHLREPAKNSTAPNPSQRCDHAKLCSAVSFRPCYIK